MINLDTGTSAAPAAMAQQHNAQGQLGGDGRTIWVGNLAILADPDQLGAMRIEDRHAMKIGKRYGS